MIFSIDQGRVEHKMLAQVLNPVETSGSDMKKDCYREESMAELFDFLRLDQDGRLVSEDKPDPKTCMNLSLFLKPVLLRKPL